MAANSIYGESHDYFPVWLSKVISELKMAANSIYWKANLRLDQSELPLREKTPVSTIWQLPPEMSDFTGV